LNELEIARFIEIIHNAVSTYVYIIIMVEYPFFNSHQPCSNVTEGVKPCNLYFFIISSSTHCQGKIWEDTLKVGCYKQPLKEIYEILHGHKGKRLVSKLKTQQ
jgi:hypothetical protein